MLKIEKDIKLVLNVNKDASTFIFIKDGAIFNNKSECHDELKIKWKLTKVIGWLKKKIKTILGCIKHK